MRKFLLSLSLVFMSFQFVIAQATYNQVTSTFCPGGAAGPNVTLTFTGTTPPSGDGTITFTYFDGDLDGGPPPAGNQEFLTFIDENGTTIGVSQSTGAIGVGQCQPITVQTNSTSTFTIPFADLANFVANGTVDFLVDASPNVSGTLCGGHGYCIFAELDYPSGQPNDIGIGFIRQPSTPTCNISDSVVVDLHNFGQNAVNSCTI